jgi:uroporphyrinogen III methyltransferase/synthase
VSPQENPSGAPRPEQAASGTPPAEGTSGGLRPEPAASGAPRAEGNPSGGARAEGTLAPTVFLVGAGPGDPGLLTLRAVELLQAADVVLYDRLVPPAALGHARPDAELVYVGKQGGGPQMPQEEIDRLLVEHGRSGKRVVRLKGGDPLVFGRGGEEALRLREAGVAFEIVPGITAGVAAPAYAGIPVTHRDLASGVAFVTGHEDPSKPGSALDWAALARFPGTLVFYMGVRELPRIAERLQAEGRPAGEPVAVVERGTLPEQRTLLATLADVAERAAAEGIRAPAVTLVGPVAALREDLAWLERRPLHGRRIAVTRARTQASALAARLRELGADVVEAPAIRTEPLPADVPDLAGYDLLVATSPNGVRELFARLVEQGRDARGLAGTTVAAMGPGTARAFGEHGIVPDVVPERSVAEGMVEALAGMPVRRALIARGREGRDVLPDALRARGAEVDVLVLYETVPEALGADALAAVKGADYVTFTSASTVRHLLAAAGKEVVRGLKLASIGPATSAELRAHGLEPDLEADPHTPDGLVDAILADARS